MMINWDGMATSNATAITQEANKAADGNYVYQVIGSHTYDTWGSYPVTVTVVNPEGDSLTINGSPSTNNATVDDAFTVTNASTTISEGVYNGMVNLGTIITSDSSAPIYSISSSSSLDGLTLSPTAIAIPAPLNAPPGEYYYEIYASGTPTSEELNQPITITVTAMDGSGNSYGIGNTPITSSLSVSPLVASSMTTETVNTGETNALLGSFTDTGTGNNFTGSYVTWDSGTQQYAVTIAQDPINSNLYDVYSTVPTTLAVGSHTATLNIEVTDSVGTFAPIQ